ncbi:hypothetical protein [Micromonospora vulcania]|uniref:Uncharacterized protein n=1 Tax=Micromonospora vulcania TaxID=1441873 RepID=A0ABW1HDL4_9ACTN
MTGDEPLGFLLRPRVLQQQQVQHPNLLSSPWRTARKWHPLTDGQDRLA